MNVSITDDELKDYILTGKSNGKYKKLARDKKFSEKLVNIYTFAIQRSYTKWAIENGYNKWIVLGRIAYETGMYKFHADETRKIFASEKKERRGT